MCSKNKGADQLRDYRTADLPLCSRMCKKQIFLMTCLDEVASTLLWPVT